MQRIAKLAKWLRLLASETTKHVNETTSVVSELNFSENDLIPWDTLNNLCKEMQIDQDLHVEVSEAVGRESPPISLDTLADTAANFCS